MWVLVLTLLLLGRLLLDPAATEVAVAQQCWYPSSDCPARRHIPASTGSSKPTGTRCCTAIRARLRTRRLVSALTPTPGASTKSTRPKITGFVAPDIENGTT